MVINQVKEPNNDAGSKIQTIDTAKRRHKKRNIKKSKSDKQEGNNLKVIHMKFASKDTARVSSFMKEYLKDSTCEIQVIPLDLPYR